MSAVPDDDFSAFWSDHDPDADQQKTGGSGPSGTGVSTGWEEPDMGVLDLRRRQPPPFPLDVLGDQWGRWTEEAASVASCPVDYVLGPLLSRVSALIGHARWPTTQGWREPPHLWTVAV